MTYETLLFEELGSGIGLLTLSRPKEYKHSTASSSMSWMSC